MPSFWELWGQASLAILCMMTVLWIVSVLLRNAAIVDLFWGLGFLLAAGVYARGTGELEPRSILLLTLVAIWSLRLSGYLTWRNTGKGEDFRYRKFREDFGPGYWWYSFFQVFLLQGILMVLISTPLLGAQLYGDGQLGVLDGIGVLVWLVGLIFEAGADLQLARFKADPDNKGKLLTTGFWRFTRHPNYFGDAAVWWGYGIISIAAGGVWASLGALLMTALIVKVSGVALLQKTLQKQKPGYAEYAARTSAFIPWFPRRKTTAAEPGQS